MDKYIYDESNGLWYELQGDYYIPCITLPTEMDMMFRLVEQMADKEGVTEQLKAENPMLWVVRMNEIQARAREIINREIIYT